MRSRTALLGLGVAVVVAGWNVFSFVRSAPIQAHIDKGVQLQLTGQNAEAGREWQEAVQLDPSNVQAWELLGDLHLKERNFSAAASAFDALFHLAPQTPDLLSRRVAVALQLQRKDKARQIALDELKANPNNITALQVVAKVERDVNPDAMLSALQKLAKLQPQSVEALNALADELESRDAYDKIIPLADRLVKLAPQTPDPYVRRGIALYTANPTEDALKRAEADLHRALSLDPDSVEAHRFLGRLYLRENQPRRAIVEFEAVGRGRPYASAHLLELSQAYRRAGNVKHADELLAHFTSLRELNTHWISLSDQMGRDPSNADLYLQMTQLLLSRALGGDSSAYHLYSFQVAREKLLPVQEYLNQARQLHAQNDKVIALQNQINQTLERLLETGNKNIRAGNFKEANESAARALVLCPGDPRTLRLTRQVMGAGFDPTPIYSPEAAPGLHRR